MTFSIFYKSQIGKNGSERFKISLHFLCLHQRVSRGPLLRCHGVQECILLVTQRISKYPVLIQRILENTTGKWSTMIMALFLVFSYSHGTVGFYCNIKEKQVHTFTIWSLIKVKPDPCVTCIRRPLAAHLCIIYIFAPMLYFMHHFLKTYTKVCIQHSCTCLNIILSWVGLYLHTQ